MKGDACGFLHKFDPERMPVCRTWMKTGECKEIDCPFKHSLDDVKECNMYKLGFCIYGNHCRYKHTKAQGKAGVGEAKHRALIDTSGALAGGSVCVCVLCVRPHLTTHFLIFCNNVHAIL